MKSFLIYIIVLLGGLSATNSYAIETHRQANTQKEKYLDLNEFGLKGDDSDEFEKINDAFRKASLEGLIITGKGTFNLFGRAVETAGAIRIKAKKKGDLIFRNGAYFFSPTDIELENTIFRDFKTAAFNYPNGRQPETRIRLQVRNCDFINNNASFFSRQESYNTMLVDSKISGSSFVNSNYAAIYLKFNYRDMVIEDNHFEGTANHGRRLAMLVQIGVDSTGGGAGLKFRNNTIRNIIHPGKDINYTVLILGDRNTVSGNTVEDISNVAFYVRGNNNTVEDNNIRNQKVTSKHAIIAKKLSPAGTLNVRNNQISGRFSTGVYVDSRFKTANITGNEIHLRDRTDTMNYAAIRILGHEEHDSLNIIDNAISVDVKGSRSVCIRINGKHFNKVNILNNRQLESSGGILLTGNNSEIKYLHVRNNTMRSKGPSPISAESIEVSDNDTNFEIEGKKGFKIKSARQMKRERNKVRETI